MTEGLVGVQKETPFQRHRSCWFVAAGRFRFALFPWALGGPCFFGSPLFIQWLKVLVCDQAGYRGFWLCRTRGWEPVLSLLMADLAAVVVMLPRQSSERSSGSSRSRSPRSRTPGCDFLARKYRYAAGAEKITFDEESHTYKFGGVVVAKSCTALVNEHFEVFDAWATVARCYDCWKVSRDERYWDIIRLVCEGGDEVQIDDDEDKRRIVFRWDALGADAAGRGTLLHAYCERVLNCAPGAPPISLVGYEAIVPEVMQHRAFMCSDFMRRHALVPYATEFLVWYTINDIVVSAGQVDAVMRSRISEEFFMIDWKRVNKKYELTENERPFAGRCGQGVCVSIPDTHFHKYSLQCSIYAEMLGQSRGVEVADRMFLVRMHEDRPAFQLVACKDWRGVARSLLNEEYARLTREQEVHV